MLRGELFATDMVRGYLEGRKLHTARPIKPPPHHIQQLRDGRFEISDDGGFDRDVRYIKPKHRPGDYIYCRETWTNYWYPDTDEFYAYKADGDFAIPQGALWGNPMGNAFVWRPSIHMPRDAARLFFRVPKVEVMRLEDVDEQVAREDGFLPGVSLITGGPWGVEDDPDEWTALEQFREFWRSTYGDARWMWVYWTEPCSREEAEGGKGK